MHQPKAAELVAQSGGYSVNNVESNLVLARGLTHKPKQVWHSKKKSSQPTEKKQHVKAHQEQWPTKIEKR